MRRNIYEIISDANVDVRREYNRLFTLFYGERHQFVVGTMSIAKCVESHFRKFDKRLIHRCISLDDFNETYDYHFSPIPSSDILEELLRFAEYTANFAWQASQCEVDRTRTSLDAFIAAVADCIAAIGYTAKEYEGVTILAEHNPAAESVAEITYGELSYKVIEYNHYRMKGDLSRKLQILKMMANDVELQRKMLNGINKSFTEDLFQMFNKFVRHDCSDNPYIADMTPDEVEVCYDDIYQMWLLAKLEIDHLDRKKRVKSVLASINES